MSKRKLKITTEAIITEDNYNRILKKRIKALNAEHSHRAASAEEETDEASWEGGEEQRSDSGEE